MSDKVSSVGTTGHRTPTADEWPLLDVLRAHRYDYQDKGSMPEDPGWHACTCGWEGYWSSFHPHVAERLATVVRATDA